MTAMIIMYASLCNRFQNRGDEDNHCDCLTCDEPDSKTSIRNHAVSRGVGTREWQRQPLARYDVGESVGKVQGSFENLNRRMCRRNRKSRKKTRIRLRATRRNRDPLLSLSAASVNKPRDSTRLASILGFDRLLHQLVAIFDHVTAQCRVD